MDNFKQQRHKDYSISFEYLSELLKSKVNKTLVSFEKIVSGVDKEVYKVVVGGEEALYVMFNHYGTALQNEVWAIEKCREKSVPVPEVLFCGGIERDGENTECMIQREVLGFAVDFLWNDLTLGEKKTVLKNLAKVLQEIHSIHTEGFYEIDRSGNWDFSNFSDMADSMFADRKSEYEYTSQVGLSKVEMGKCLELILLYKGLLEDFDPVLCHGDVYLRHVYVDESLNISGLIDFGGFQGGLIFKDFEDLFYELESDLWNVFISNYFEGNIPEDFDIRIHLHQVNYLLKIMASSVKKGRFARAEKMLRRLRELLVVLESYNLNII